MGNTTFPLYIYELIQAVQKYEDEHPKFAYTTDDEGPNPWCMEQWLKAIPEEHRRLATMLDDLKAHIASGGEDGRNGI